MNTQERILRREISKCLKDIRRCEAELDQQYCAGEAFSSPAMVGLGDKFTGLWMKLSELDRQYEELILNAV